MFFDKINMGGGATSLTLASVRPVTPTKKVQSTPVAGFDRSQNSSPGGSNPQREGGKLKVSASVIDKRHPVIR